MKNIFHTTGNWVCLLCLVAIVPITQAYATLEEAFDAYTREDYELAFQNFMQATELGDPHAQYNVGLMHVFGHGTPADYGEAAEWFRKAASQGLPEAQNALGAILARTPWPDEAVRQFQAAAEQGDALAQYNLASMYAAGHGVAVDPARAHYWRSLALNQGLELSGTYNFGALAGSVMSGQHIRSEPFPTLLRSTDAEPDPSRFVRIAHDGGVLPVQSGVWSDRGNERLGTKWSCVIDTTTGLMWEVKHRGNENDIFVFASAAGYARNASICGGRNWRLPTRQELLSVVDVEATAPPLIDTGNFPKVRAAFYWTSEVDPRRTDQAFGVTFSNGRVVTANQAGRNRAMLVRGGP